MDPAAAELLRRVYDDPMGALSLAAPDIEFDLSDLYPDWPTVRGLDAAREYYARGPWAFLRFNAEEYHEIEPGHYLVAVRVTASGNQSGVPIERRVAHELVMRDGRFVRLKVHGDPDHAKREFGLA